MAFVMFFTKFIQNCIVEINVLMINWIIIHVAVYSIKVQFNYQSIDISVTFDLSLDWLT